MDLVAAAQADSKCIETRELAGNLTHLEGTSETRLCGNELCAETKALINDRGQMRPDLD